MDSLSVLATAKEMGPRLALRFGRSAWSWMELSEWVLSVLRGLDAEELPLGVRVGVCGVNTPATLVFLLALMERGNPFVLLHPRWTAREQKAVLDDAKCFRFFSTEEIAWFADRKVSAERAPKRLNVGMQAECALLYTSGTTGSPKGARLSRSAFVASAKASAEALSLRSSDAWLLSIPLCHIGGLSIVTRSLFAGSAMVLHEVFNEERVLNAPENEGATIVSVVPTMLSRLLERDEHGLLRGFRTVLSGGAETERKVRSLCRERSIALRTTYGLTEACSQVTLQRGDEALGMDSGIALPGVQVRICDEQRRVLSAGQEGSIEVRGTTMMDGYEHQVPLGTDWFSTNDLGVLDEAGRLTVRGRRSELIVSGGENVYPAEVERVLKEAPGVLDALVFGIASERWGQNVAVALVLAEGVLLGSVKQHAERLLARFKVPKWCCVVRALPVLSNGKIARSAACSMFRNALEPW